MIPKPDIHKYQKLKIFYSSEMMKLYGNPEECISKLCQ